jgi:hypothetical protein
MAKKIFGYTLFGFGLVAVTFFAYYKGDMIRSPFLWMLVSAGIAIIGSILVFTARTNKEIKKAHELSASLTRLKEAGELLKVDLDNCEFKVNDFTEEISSENSLRVQMYDSLYDPNRNYNTQNVNQLVIIYHHKHSGQIEKFTSQTFNIDETTFRFDILQGRLNLYVDRFDRNHYFFELNK